MRIGKYGRFVPAIIVALTLHVGFLLAHLSEDTSVVLPEPLPIQRIAVSLGSKSEKTPPKQEVSPEQTVEPPSEKDTQETAQEKEEQQLPKPTKEPPDQKIPDMQPEPTVVEPPSRVIQPEHIKKVIVSHKKKVLQLSPPVFPKKDTGKETAPAEAAARIIQKASPLYQINPPPKYPRIARRRGYEGTVVLEVFVDESGRPKKVVLFSSSGHTLLDKAALKAVRNWRFQPGRIDGISEAMNVKVPVRFQLKDS